MKRHALSLVGLNWPIRLDLVHPVQPRSIKRRKRRSRGTRSLANRDTKATTRRCSAGAIPLAAVRRKKSLSVPLLLLLVFPLWQNAEVGNSKWSRRTCCSWYKNWGERSKGRAVECVPLRLPSGNACRADIADQPESGWRYCAVDIRDEFHPQLKDASGNSSIRPARRCRTAE